MEDTNQNPKDRERAIRFIKFLLFSASIMPSLLAGAVVISEGRFTFLPWFLAALGLFIGQVAGDYLYYYFTHFHSDQRDAHTKIFAGWKPLFTGKWIKPEHTLYAGFLCLGAALLIGLWFYFRLGPAVLVLAAIGGAVAIFFTPLMLRGLKEPVVFITFGPLSVLGVYFVMTGEMSFKPIIASLPIAFLVTLVAYLKSARFEVQSEGDDSVVLKISQRTIRMLLLLAYIALVMAVFAGWMPWFALLGVLTAPYALKLGRSLQPKAKVAEYLWATVSSLWIFIGTAGLITIGYLLVALFSII